MPHNKISSLMRAVPNASLQLGSVGGDKPGILSGNQPICRLKEGPEGEAYGALIVGAVNALPQLLAAPQRSAKGQCVDGMLRDQVVQRISNVLAMRPGGKKTQTSIWAKLIWTTVESCLAENLDPSGGDAASAVANLTVVPETIQSARYSAVLEFSAMLLAACETQHESGMPDFEPVISEWVQTLNTHPKTAAG
ncbi:hypothetical protein [Pseudomonas sp. UMAB-40]|uniref:hypothetical protein n=1 Tax=Pseudomonas sp. UMAB-40 TaxID=1365407 RepID=UPI001C57F80D|nr:hypothetical protein [Pseudomonas sp. UMAB-40]